MVPATSASTPPRGTCSAGAVVFSSIQERGHETESLCIRSAYPLSTRRVLPCHSLKLSSPQFVATSADSLAYSWSQRTERAVALQLLMSTSVFLIIYLVFASW
jgi:hypothetical protein